MNHKYFYRFQQSVLMVWRLEAWTVKIARALTNCAIPSDQYSPGQIISGKLRPKPMKFFNWMKPNYLSPFQLLDTRWSLAKLEDGCNQEEDAVAEDGDGERDGESRPARRWVQGGHQPCWEDWGVGGFSSYHPSLSLSLSLFFSALT